MGCPTRYNNNTTVIERIVTKVLDALRDPETVVGQPTHNNNVEDLIRGIIVSENVSVISQIKIVRDFCRPGNQISNIEYQINLLNL